jgi:hypothetical protein
MMKALEGSGPTSASRFRRQRLRHLNICSIGFPKPAYPNLGTVDSIRAPWQRYQSRVDPVRASSLPSPHLQYLQKGNNENLIPTLPLSRRDMHPTTFQAVFGVEDMKNRESCLRSSIAKTLTTPSWPTARARMLTP